MPNYQIEYQTNDDAEHNRTIRRHITVHSTGPDTAYFKARAQQPDMAWSFSITNMKTGRQWPLPHSSLKT